MMVATFTKANQNSDSPKLFANPQLMKKKKGEKKRAPVPARDVRKPVVDHNLRGNEVNGNRHGPAVDVIDGQGVPEARIHKSFAVGGKGAAYRGKGGKFAQRRHQKVHYHADHKVDRKRPARSRLTDRGAGGHKSPVPIEPPSASIVRCRGFRVRLS